MLFSLLIFRKRASTNRRCFLNIIVKKNFFLQKKSLSTNYSHILFEFEIKFGIYIVISNYVCSCKEDALKIEQEWCEKLRPNLNSISPFA
jgi:hypothetical protein